MAPRPCGVDVAGVAINSVSVSLVMSCSSHVTAPLAVSLYGSSLCAVGSADHPTTVAQSYLSADDPFASRRILRRLCNSKPT